MDVKILEDRSEGCEIHIHCQSREDKEVKQLLFLLESTRKRIPASRQRQTFLLKPSQILYAEAVEGSVFLYTADQVYSSPYSLSFLEKEYGEDGFFRCGKSAAVNLRQTEQLRSQPGGRLLLTLSNGEKILVSRRYAAVLRRQLAGSTL